MTESSDILDALNVLRGYGEKNRALIRLALQGLALLFLLIIAVAVLTVQVYANSRALTQVCEANRTLWQPIIDASKKNPPPRGETPEERKRRERQTAEFQKSLDDCK